MPFAWAADLYEILAKYGKSNDYVSLLNKLKQDFERDNARRLNLAAIPKPGGLDVPLLERLRNAKISGPLYKPNHSTRSVSTYGIFKVLIYNRFMNVSGTVQADVDVSPKPEINILQISDEKQQVYISLPDHLPGLINEDMIACHQIIITEEKLPELASKGNTAFKVFCMDAAFDLSDPDVRHLLDSQLAKVLLET